MIFYEIIFWRALLFSALVLLAGPAPFSRGEITKGPYLQDVRVDRITVMWETLTSTGSRVDYGPTVAYGSFAEGTAWLSHCNRYIHRVVLPGLAGETAYYYRAQSDGVMSPGYSFRTAAAVGTPFTLAIYGDNRGGPAGTRHSEVVDAILAGGLPDLVINSGDLTWQGARCAPDGGLGWGPEYFTPAQPLLGRVPGYISVGNHEYYNVQTEPDLIDPPVNFQDYFSFPDNGSPDPINRDLYYSFDYGDAHFMVLNSNYYFTVAADFKPSSDQYEWLVNELKNTGATWKFVIFHHPPYFSLPPFEDYDTRFPVQAYLVPVFERYGVQMVINGHVHLYERSRKRGINYIVSAGGGASLTPLDSPRWNPYRITARSLYHYCRLRIDGPRLSLAALDTGNIPFDAFTLDLTQDEDKDGRSNGDEYSSGWDPDSIYSPVPDSSAVGDYNGDGRSEPAIFRPEEGLWSIRGVTACRFGGDGDWPAAGDFDGDGTADIAIFRSSSGLWAVRDLTRFYFGTYGDLPLPADYTGNGFTTAGIFRPESGLWALRGLTRYYFGRAGDIPVPGDYDGAGRREGAIFRPAIGLWAVRGLTRIYFGVPGDLPRARDYNGDGSDDISIYRGSTGLWALRGISRFYFGTYRDYPIPAAYTAGGDDTPAIFRPARGLWAIRNYCRIYFGEKDDIPISR